MNRAFLTPEQGHMRDAFVGNPEPPGRVLDLKALLAVPFAPIPWVCDQLAAAGMLTTVVGPAALGKSWLTLSLAAAVHHGSHVGGIRCAKGHALYVDAENGERIMTDRVRAAALDHDALTIVDADRLDLAQPAHLAWLQSSIRSHGASLVILDSLKRMTPRTRESENDDMAPVVAGLGRLARNTGAAVLVIHHKSSKSESADFRGASAILDQTDMMFALSGTTERFKLDPLKFRVGPKPAPRWLGLRSSEDGLVTVEATGGNDEHSASRRTEFRNKVIALAPEITDRPWTFAEIARATGVDKAQERTLQRALTEVVELDGWTRDHNGYQPPDDERTDMTPYGEPSCLSAQRGEGQTRQPPTEVAVSVTAMPDAATSNVVPFPLPPDRSTGAPHNATGIPTNSATDRRIS